MVNKIDPFTPSFYTPPSRIEEVRDAEDKPELFRAVEQGNLSEVKRLLSLGADPNSRDASDTSILEAALSLINDSPISKIKANAIIHELIASGASYLRQIKTQFEYWNIFDYAFSNGNFGLLFLLREHFTQEIPVSNHAWKGFFVSEEIQDLEFITKYYPRSYLQSALEKLIYSMISQKEIPIDNLQTLITKYQNLFSQDCTHSPLFLITLPKLTEKLLANGMRVDIQDESGQTALHYLARGIGHPFCLPLLLQASTSLIDPVTLIQLALQHNNATFIEEMKKSEFAKTIPKPAIHAAILANDLSTIEKECANCNYYEFDILGQLPFQTAIRYGSLDAVKFLAHFTPKDGLIFAAAYGSVEIVSFLFSFYFPTAAPDKELIQILINKAKSARNNQVAAWIIQQYALQYPDAVGPFLLDEGVGTTSLTLVEACVQKLKELQDPDMEQVIGGLFIEALEQKLPEMAELLLKYTDDTSFFAEEVDDFYWKLFNHPKQEFIEKTIKKLGIAAEAFLKDYQLIPHMKKTYPDLFAQFALQIFEQGVQLCQDEELEDYSPLMLLAVCSGQMSLIERCENEFGLEALFHHMDLLECAIQGGSPEVVAYVLKKFPIHWDTSHSLLLAIKLGKRDVLKTLLQTGMNVGVNVYSRIFWKQEESKKELLIQTIQLQRADFTKLECEELALLLMQDDPHTHVQVFCSCIQHAATFSALKREYLFAQKLHTLCRIPCVSTRQMGTWLAQEVLGSIRSKNPKLFEDEQVFDTICDLVASISTPDEYGVLFEAMTATHSSADLVSAVRGKSKEALPHIVPIRPPCIYETRDGDGKTELFRAVERGALPEIKKLLSLGYDPNSHDTSGKTMIEAALALTGSKVYTIISLLVSRGASCTRKIGTEYLNIFDYAFSCSNYGLLFALYPYYKPHIKIRPAVLTLFCQTCEVQDLEFVVRHYPSIKFLPLHFIGRNRLDLLKKYVEIKGEQVVDNEVLSLISLAFQNRNLEMADFLRAHGATFDNTPGRLIWDPRTTKWLLEKGISCNEQDNNGWSALHFLAAGGGNSECLPILLQAGADPLLAANDGKTALARGGYQFREQVRKSGVVKEFAQPSLHEAILSNDFLKIEKERATFDFETRDIFGYTAFELAILHRSLDAVKLLSQCVKKEDLMLAAAWSSTEVVSFLLSLFPQEQETLSEMLNKAQEKQTASLLLDHIGDPSYWGGVKGFYMRFVSEFDQAFIEKAIKKFGFTDACLEDDVLVEALCERYPALFAQLAPELFVRAMNLKLPFTPLLLAIYNGQESLVDLAAAQFSYNYRACLKAAIKADKPELVLYFYKKIPDRDYKELLLAIELGNENCIDMLVQACEQQQITIDSVSMYTHILRTSQSQKQLARAIGIQRPDFAEWQREEIAGVLLKVSKYSAAIDAIASCIKRVTIFSQLIEEVKIVTTFLHKLSTACKMPCSHYTLFNTVDYILRQVFDFAYNMNPTLFKDEAVFDTILDLVARVDSQEDYEALFVALQVAPDIEVGAMAFQAAQLLERGKAVKPLKKQFLESSYEEQKRWLAYARVFRDRAFIPHCHHIIKHHAKYPDARYPALLLDAIHVIHKIGVKRYNAELENTLPRALQNIIQISSDEEVKIAALCAYMSSGSPSHKELCDFLLTQLEEARRGHSTRYEVQIIRLLGTEYEWTADQSHAKAVEQLLIGLQSQHEEVRFQTALTLSAIPHEQGLLAALDAVQGPTWDRMLPHFKKDRQNITGSCFLFRSRPDELHDNRNAVVRRIQLQLVALHPEPHTEDPDYLKQRASLESAFRIMPKQPTRHVGIHVAYPPGTDLIRGLSTRKGGSGFREAVKDLLRKGAGSSQLTDYDTFAFSSTWNKIGHIFASHDKELHFGNQAGSIYFSAGKNGVVTESALIIFPAAYYQKEYLAGQARLEKEGTLNNVLYRGIPHRWIKAVYLPIRFKKDIELLSGDTPIEEVKNRLTSDLFKGETSKELEAFRRLLTAHEMDLTNVSHDPVSFVEKIRYFPAVGVKEVEKILLEDGVHFATEDEIKKETAKQTLKVHRNRKMRFLCQDIFLAAAPDTQFKANIELLFKMLPQSLFPPVGKAKQKLMALQTDSYTQFRSHVRVALLLHDSGGKACAVLAQNPHFYGLHRRDIPLVVSLIEKSACSDTRELEQAYAALKRKDLSFEVYCQMLLELKKVVA